MIKRRFYKLEHGDKDGPSNLSSSSNSEIEPQATDDSDEEEEYDAVEQLKDDAQSCSTSSGYQSEDSSANKALKDDDASTGHEIPYLIADQLLVDLLDCIVKCKSTFKCKLCPRVVCLNEKSLRAHLKGMPRKKSKRQDKNGSKKRTRYGVWWSAI
nr:uncharacterized protein LOC103402230 [Malus domestica]